MSLYTDANLIMYPSGYKASEIYSLKPTDGSGDISFSRSTTKTYIDASGTRQTAATNVMPVSYEGGGCGKFNFEPQRTNLILNSDTLVTQNITTSATSYALSFEGTGTVTISGTYSGSLVGAGTTPSNRVSLVFTATAGTLTLTVSGSVVFSQTEAGDYPTSYIPTGATTVTRNLDESVTTGISSVINSSEGVLYINAAAASSIMNGRFVISDGGSSNRVMIFYTSVTNELRIIITGGGTSILDVTQTLADITVLHKVAVKWKSGDNAVWINGVETDSNSFAAAPSGIDSLHFKRSNVPTSYFYGEFQALAVYPSILTDSQLTELTTL
tara:strand:- start:166 stop:1149 length:984 start_codon:yes stop_codon:yes gene_type:complete